MFELIIGSNRFSSFNDFQRAPSDLSEYSLEAFSFCKDWLNGQKVFELQTSGSTGTPKTIKVNRSQMIASALATKSFFDIQENIKMLCCMNTSYIAGKMMLVRAMVWDSPILIIEPSSNPLSYLQKNFNPQFIAMAPIQVDESLKFHLKELKQIDHLIIGGAPISKNLKSLISKNKLNAYQSFGMTETVSHIALAPIKEGDLVYEILPGVEFGIDERHALWTKSPMSNNQIIQTNDLVKLVSENSFQWLGRADFVVNSGGVKLHPEILEPKIESIVNTHFPDSNFFLFGLPDDLLGQKLVLFVETASAEKEKAKNLQAELKVKLGKYESPKEVYLIREFIRTDSGKINRQKTSDFK
ncbi:AMP-binding protein [Algoriphagus sp.]|uniref:AMP-binding protein n=1 Tax=Algoriphagus sp. TaxID=1872435 RepID=UPI0025E3C7AF|nr:AMP-binding protein [Algoriphagus sp.]